MQAPFFFLIENVAYEIQMSNLSKKKNEMSKKNHNFK